MSVKYLPPAVFLMGPTASGKTAATVLLAQHFPVEIISVDSALVYRDMDIGTAKPDAETLRLAPHQLIDVISPLAQFSAAEFVQQSLQLMHQATAQGKLPVLVGGTMLYFNALQHGLSQLPPADSSVRLAIEAEAHLHGWPAMHAQLSRIDPITAARIQPNDQQRIERALEVYRLSGQPMSALHAQTQRYHCPFQLLKIGLLPSDRSVLHQRIATRFAHMLDSGLLAEVEALFEKYPGLNADTPSMRCVGYRQALQYLAGEISLAQLAEQGVFATRQLAKRQLTWLRGMSDLIGLDCLDEHWQAEALQLIEAHLKQTSQAVIMAE